MTTKNPYLILNISPTANDHEIKVQYKKLAKKYHPDTHPDDTIAMEKMLELNEAYEMLKNQSASDMAFSDASFSNVEFSQDIPYSHHSTKSGLFSFLSDYLKLTFAAIFIFSFLVILSASQTFSHPNASITPSPVKAPSSFSFDGEK